MTAPGRTSPRRSPRTSARGLRRAFAAGRSAVAAAVAASVALASCATTHGPGRHGHDRVSVSRLVEERFRVGFGSLTPIRYEVTVAEERLRNLTGLSGFTFALVPEDAPFERRTEVPVDELVAEAVASRPDAEAADQAASAAVERLRVARIGWVRFLGIGDATSGLKRDHELGPGLRMTLPIFNHGQGLISRAEAEAGQLDRRRQTMKSDWSRF